MGNKLFEVGDPNGSYYEYVRQTGGDTPYAMRAQGKFSDNPYSFERKGFIDTFPMTHFFSSTGKSLLLSTSQKRARSWFSASTSLGTPPGTASIYADLDAEWKNSPINLGMYFSPEGRESIEMLGGTIVRIGGAARDLKRGNIEGFFRNLRQVPRKDRQVVLKKYDQGDLSGAFLAAHLGWEPLIKDAYSISEGIKDPKTSGGRIKANKGWTGAYSYATRLPAGCNYVGKSFGVNTILLQVAREPTMSERFGMANPFLIAWELVPLSFVADYFLPISDVITALGFVGQRGAREGWFKTYFEESIKFEAPPGTLKINNGSTYFTNRETATFRSYRKGGSRSPYTVSYAHALSVDTKLPKSVMKLSTLASLAHQNILSLLRK